MGCKWLRVSHAKLYGIPWYHYGKVDENGLWHFNRDWLEGYLKKYIKEHFIKICPIFDYQEAVVAPLNTLPKIIDPEADPRFIYATEQDPLKGQVITGIKYNEGIIDEPEFKEENETYLKGEDSLVDLGEKLKLLEVLKKRDEIAQLKKDIRKAKPKDFK